MITFDILLSCLTFICILMYTWVYLCLKSHQGNTSEDLKCIGFVTCIAVAMSYISAAFGWFYAEITVIVLLALMLESVRVMVFKLYHNWLIRRTLRQIKEALNAKDYLLAIELLSELRKA